MEFNFSLYFLPLIIAVIFSCIVILYVWRFKPLPIARTLLLLTFVGLWWSFWNFFEYGWENLALKKICANLEYFGILSIALLWFILVAQYVGKDRWVTKNRIILLSLIPIITIIFVWTNSYHGLMRHNIHLDTSGPFSVLAKDYGPWFWVATVYNYTLIMLGLYLLIRQLIRAPRFYRAQILILIISGIMPFLGNMLYLSNLNPLHPVDLTSTFLSISAVLIVFGLFRLNLMEIVPIARDYLVENLEDGLLVMDTQKRIIDFNYALQNIFKAHVTPTKSKYIKDLFSRYPEIMELIEKNASETDIQIGSQIFNLRHSRIRDTRQQLIGGILLFKNITQRKKVEMELEENIVYLKKALEDVKTLSGLLPICASCKKIRDDRGYWNEVEKYIVKHSGVIFSHSICPDCLNKYYPDVYTRIRNKKKSKDNK